MARRPLIDLANATGALVALSFEMAGQGIVIDVLPGTGRLPHEPSPALAAAGVTISVIAIAIVISIALRDFGKRP